MSPLRIDIHLHGGFNTIAELKTFITREFKKMSAALDRLTTEVNENTAVIDSAVTLINGLAQQIRDAVDDPAKLNALADELDAKSNALAAAVAANTPAPPTTEPPAGTQDTTA